MHPHGLHGLSADGEQHTGDPCPAHAAPIPRAVYASLSTEVLREFTQIKHTSLHEYRVTAGSGNCRNSRDDRE